MALVLIVTWSPAFAKNSNCISCHRTVMPNIIKDFLDGALWVKAAASTAPTATARHHSRADVAKVKMPTEATCNQVPHQEKALVDIKKEVVSITREVGKWGREQKR